MKKIIFLLLLIIILILAWKYFKNPQRKTTATEQTIDATVNYVPNAIERKNTMENKINESMAKENEQRLNSAMKELP